jgi:AraC family transcriptional regulator
VGTECYGVSICAADPAGVSTRAFDYIACVQVASPDRAPEGMRGFTVPAGTFAVFVHRGPISKFADTLHKIWGEWIPAAGLRPTGAPDFERYDDRFRGGAEDSEFEVWVPIQPKA